MSTSGRGRGSGDGEPSAPPIPSFESLRGSRRSHPAMDVLAPPPVAVAEPARAVPATAPRPAAPRPAEWPDLLRFSLRMTRSALRLPAAVACAPARGLRRLLGE